MDLLVNNAGVALGGTFEQISDSDFEWLFAINFWGAVRMTRAFLSLLHLSNEGRLVYISGLISLIAPPGQTAYAESKCAVRGFSDSLRHELESARVGVTVVYPAGVATSIAKNARRPSGMSVEEAARKIHEAEATLTMRPEHVGEIVVRGIERRRARVLVGSRARIASIIERLFPVSYWKLIRTLMKS